MLSYLPTDLSFREIAENVGVSRSAVRSHAVAIYQKLGVTARPEAVAARKSSDCVSPQTMDL